MKEIKFTPNTQLHDIKHKISRVPEWLAAGEKVRLTVKFSGREMNHPETGKEVLDLITELLQDAQVDRAPSMDGKIMFSILSRKSAKNIKKQLQTPNTGI